MKQGLMLVALAALCWSRSRGQAAAGGDAILGVWRAQEKTLAVEIYKTGQEYRARLVSFTDHHTAIPSAERTDEHNPDAAERGRKLIGIDVLSGLHYSRSKEAWLDGRIYDVGSGNSYSASAALNGGTLTVRAYKGISLVGKTLHFRR